MAMKIPTGADVVLPSGAGIVVIEGADPAPPPPVGARAGDEVVINGVRYRCVQFLFLVAVQ